MLSGGYWLTRERVLAGHSGCTWCALTRTAVTCWNSSGMLWNGSELGRLVVTVEDGHDQSARRAPDEPVMFS
jgi:hypothetical protein